MTISVVGTFMSFVPFFYIFLAALFTSLIMVPLLHRWAMQTGQLDQPDARKVHVHGVPRIGGIAVFMAFLFACLIFAEMTPSVRGLLAGGLIIFFVGLIDDLHGLSPKRKFFGQIGGALVTMIVGQIYLANLGDLFGFGEIILPFWLAVPATVFAVVGVCNALNLIDGLDGLAGGVAVIALSTFFVFAGVDKNLSVMTLCAALLGAIFGFLKYNFYPARIFMGDAGSLSLGFAVAFIAIDLTQHPASQIDPISPLLVLGVPIVDTLWVFARRMYHGGSPFAADRTHVHHKFLQLGFEHRFTVLIIYGLCFFWAAFSLVFYHYPTYLQLLSFFLVSLVFYLALRYLLRHPERFSWILSRDDSTGIRTTVTYKRIAEKLRLLETLLGLTILSYLGLAITAILSRGNSQGGYAALLLLLGTIFFVLFRRVDHPGLLAILYLSSLLICFLVERTGHLSFWGGWEQDQGVNLLFGLMALLIFLRATFRHDGDFFFSSLDILLLGSSLVLMIIPEEFSSLYWSQGTTLKGILLFLGVKVLISLQPKFSLVVVAGVGGGVLTALLRSFW
ncbi:MAG: hypothetical protein C0621_08820 [Desulfuromonas sp.]|nr:MAG: hypothetical protein C0621_08820 [Desulfuromonas sp.]